MYGRSEINARGDHNRGVDQRRTGIGPAIASAATFAIGSRADYTDCRQAASRRHCNVLPLAMLLRASSTIRGRVQGAQFRYKKCDSIEGEGDTSLTRVTTTLSSPAWRRSSDRCCSKTDQQVNRGPRSLPNRTSAAGVIGQYQNHHAGINRLV